MASVAVVVRLTLGSDAGRPIDKDNYSMRFVGGDGEIYLGAVVESGDFDSAKLDYDVLPAPECNLMVFKSRDPKNKIFDEVGTLRRGDVVDFQCTMEWYSYTDGRNVRRGLRLTPVTGFSVVEARSKV